MRGEGYNPQFAAYFGQRYMRRLRFITASIGLLPLVSVLLPSYAAPLMGLFYLGLFFMSVIWLVVGIRDKMCLAPDAPTDARLARTTVIACSLIMLGGFALIAVMTRIP